MISIFIPVHNGAKYIKTAIDSCFAQTYSDFEIIVVDDGSTDETKSIVEKENVRYFYQENTGVSSARNLGIEKARGEWIAFLDSDDFFSHDKLEKQMKVVEKDNTLDVVFCLYHNFTALDRKNFSKPQLRLFWEKHLCVLVSALIRKSLFSRIGLFDTKYCYGEDTDFIARLFIYHIKTYTLPEHLYYRRVHDNNLSFQCHYDNQPEFRKLMMDSIHKARNRMKVQKKDFPLVTIVTPVYNAMPYFKEYLDSVLHQTYRPIELIVVDDGSTDDSYHYIEEFRHKLEDSGITVQLFSSPHRNQSAAINVALPHIHGKYFMCSDADDLLMPDNISLKVEYMKAHPELGMCRADAKIVNGDTKEFIGYLAREKDKKIQNIFDDCFKNMYYVYSGCYLLDTNLFFACYPEKQMPECKEGQNLQLLLPISTRTECGFLPDVLYVYMKRSSGHASQKRTYREQQQRVENFISLRKQLLPYCKVDSETYLKKLENYAKKERDGLYQSLILSVRKKK